MRRLVGIVAAHWLLLRRSSIYVTGCLFIIILLGQWRRGILYADVILRENARLSSPDILALPPFRIAVLGYGDVIAGFEVQVARVWVVVAVECNDVGDFVVLWRLRVAGW